MNHKTKQLIRYADLLGNKYGLIKRASIDANTIRNEIKRNLTIDIANASAVSNSGIMPFTQMQKEDKVSISFEVGKEGKQIMVSPVSLSDSSLSNKYQPLTQQVKTYLEKNWELFPQYKDGQSVDYSSFTIKLDYPLDNGIGSDNVAQQ